MKTSAASARLISDSNPIASLEETSELAKQDPAAAFESLTSLGPGSLRDNHILVIFLKCRREALLALLERVKTTGYPEDLQRGLTTLLERTDLPLDLFSEAAAYADCVPARVRDTFTNQLQAEKVKRIYLAGASFDSLGEIINKLPPGQMRYVWSSVSALQLARTDLSVGPSELLENLPETMPAQAQQAYAARAVQAMLGFKAPSEIAASLEVISDDSLKEEAGELLFHRWLALDSLAASRWLKLRPSDSLRDNLSLILVEHLCAHGSEEDAMRWAGQISDEKLRARAVAVPDLFKR